MPFPPITWTPAIPRFRSNASHEDPNALRAELRAVEKRYLNRTYRIYDLEEALSTGIIPDPFLSSLPGGHCTNIRPVLHTRWNEILAALESCKQELDNPKEIRAFIQSVAGVKKVPLGLRGSYTKADAVEHIRLAGFRNLLNCAKERRRHLQGTMAMLRDLILEADRVQHESEEETVSLVLTDGQGPE